ncbi:hypothetical protein T492DRAFT_535826 [Pavlovales sp. CCMP2436]|nr:hypothetical protein T492DRAFT_535826 [Pavlovales sp. CCMP2436]
MAELVAHPAAVETITARTRLQDAAVGSLRRGGSGRGGKRTTVLGALERVRVWSLAVAQLTLLPLGQSAPLLFLTLAELASSRFKTSAIGPAALIGANALTWFGSLLVATWALPGGESRQLRSNAVAQIGMFAVLGPGFFASSLSFTSPGTVRVWEASVALCLLLLLLFTAWTSERSANRAAVRADGFARLREEDESAITLHKMASGTLRAHPVSVHAVADLAHAPSHLRLHVSCLMIFVLRH